jgi:4-hydroxy-4-methyl-2-oxoglutarate aldolase
MAKRAIRRYSGRMPDASAFLPFSPTTLADCLPRRQIMGADIYPLWSGMPRVAGPAYTARCCPGDNLMLHAAIHRAPAGCVVVVEGGDAEFALAGGNVCAVAQKNGIVAFVLDGVVRDIAEIRAMRFPVFAKGVLPKPGAKELLGTLQQPIRCGGVAVSPDDVIVADEEGIVVVPAGECAAVLEAAQARATADASQSLEEWRAAHRARVAKTLADRGFSS